MQITTELKQLIAQAENGLKPAASEAQRILTICNACRYCEGFCAVFPAMTRRLDFASDDIHYLANLCHNCGACLHACQYAPPHEFAVNIPQTLSSVRLDTYQDYAWPAALAGVYSRNGIALAFGLASLFTVLFVLNTPLGAVFWFEPIETPPLHANFYAIFPHNSMALIFGLSFTFAMVSLGIGVYRFWTSIKHGTTPKARTQIKDLMIAGQNAATMRYLGGGHGDGCNEESDRYTHARRYLHHATMYGFLLCFAATTLATVYHYGFGWQAPYAYTSVPVMLGTLGGIGLIIGPLGLLWLSIRRHPLHGDATQKPMDRSFISLLLGMSATGLALLAWRESNAMPALLCLHLGWVASFFTTLPYSKFVHGAYRYAALLKWSIEMRSPSQLKLGDE